MPTSHRRLWMLLLSLFIVPPGLLLAFAGTARADTRLVDCSQGRRIGAALRLPAGRALTITVRGTCTENLEITRDDVTLQGDAGATVQLPTRTGRRFSSTARGAFACWA